MKREGMITRAVSSRGLVARAGTGSVAQACLSTPKNYTVSTRLSDK
jgi:hypothetical protein